MIYLIYSIVFLIFIFLSYQLTKILLKTPDIMKFIFYVLIYIVGILIFFQILEKILITIYKVSKTELNFMFLMYLLTTMIAFLGIAIITIKKMKKK